MQVRGEESHGPWGGGDPTRRSVDVPVAELLPGESPRSAGIDEGHARMLADTCAQLPPVVVHKRSMRVIDGAHRVRAAVLRGDTKIAVTYIDGDDADIFVAAVEANVRHGLPLSLEDRQAAARRILATHGHWSDRSIASVAGLSPTTVGKIRRMSTVQSGQSKMRRSRDGRMRPANHGQRWLTTTRRIEDDSAPTSRTVAEQHGPSLSAVRSACRRLKADRGVMSSREARLLIQWSGIANVERDHLSAIIRTIPTHNLRDMKTLCDAAA